MSKYTAESQQRVLKVLDVLFGHEITGIDPTSISKAVGCSPSNTTRDLANLKEAGFAEQLTDNGRWRISPRVGQRAVAILHTIDRTQRQLDEVRGRYTQTQ